MLAPHLLCAAYEGPLTDADLELFGGDGARALAGALEAEGALRRRRDGLRPGSGRSQADQVDIRNAGGGLVTGVAADSGQVIGTVDRARAPSTVHRGAVLPPPGRALPGGRAGPRRRCRPGDRGQGRRVHPGPGDVDVTVVEPTRQVELPRSTLWLGRVDVSEQVVGYERRRVGTGELLGYEDLDLPPARLQTVAYWYTLSPGLLDAAALDTRTSPAPPTPPSTPRSGCSPVRHVRPLGHRRPLHRLASRHRVGHDLRLRRLPRRRRHRRAGPPPRPRPPPRHPRHRRLLPLRHRVCPSCVQSPKCGNGNNPLDKAGAVRLLDELLTDLGAVPAATVAAPTGRPWGPGPPWGGGSEPGAKGGSGGGSRTRGGR